MSDGEGAEISPALAVCQINNEAMKHPRRLGVHRRFSFLLFYQDQQADNIRSCLPGLRIVTRNATFHGAWWYSMRVMQHAGTETRRERAESCDVRARKARNSTRVAAASWPTITELTPTVVLHRLFTCRKQRTGFKCRVLLSAACLIPPLREFLAALPRRQS